MENNNAKSYSIAALVCGILGIVGSFIPVVCYFTFVLAILGIVFGVKGRKLAQPDQKGLATAGFVLGIIGTVIGALGIICVVCAVGIFSAAGVLRTVLLLRCIREHHHRDAEDIV